MLQNGDSLLKLYERLLVDVFIKTQLIAKGVLHYHFQCAIESFLNRRTVILIRFE